VVEMKHIRENKEGKNLELGKGELVGAPST